MKKELSPKSLKLAIFDWSGTISDDRQIVYEVNNNIRKRVGIPIVPFEEWLPTTMVNLVEFLQSEGFDYPEEEIKELYEEELALAKKKGLMPRVYPDAIETFKYLVGQGFKITVLSAHPTTHLRSEAKIYGLAPFISLFVGNSTNKSKDLKIMTQRLGVTTGKEAIFGGDTIFDIRAAKENGVLSAAFCSGYHTRERLAAENPDLIFNQLADMRSWLEVRNL